MSDPTEPQTAEVWPIVWRDEDGHTHNAWSMNLFTGEIYRDPDGDPLYTTVPPPGGGPVDVGDDGDAAPSQGP